jgi:hypothetical protein
VTEEACSHSYVVPEISDTSKYNCATSTQLLQTNSSSHQLNLQIYLGSVHDGVRWDNAANIALMMSELDYNFIFRFFEFIVFFGDTQLDRYFCAVDLQPVFQNFLYFINPETSVKILLSGGSLTLKRDTWSFELFTNIR